MDFTKDEIKYVIQESLSECLERMGILTEMAMSLKDFKNRIFFGRVNLVENWCLCKYCQLFDRENTCFSHWKRELRECLSSLKRVELKSNVDPRKPLKKVLVDDCELNNPSIVKKLINDKFNEERLFNREQDYIVCEHFANALPSLIEYLGVGKEEPNEYIAIEFE
jgi:hypothetical protein